MLYEDRSIDFSLVLRLRYCIVFGLGGREAHMESSYRSEERLMLRSGKEMFEIRALPFIALKKFHILLVCV